jgi:hypothetical protein
MRGRGFGSNALLAESIPMARIDQAAGEPHGAIACLLSEQERKTYVRCELYWV